MFPETQEVSHPNAHDSEQKKEHSMYFIFRSHSETRSDDELRVHLHGRPCDSEPELTPETAVLIVASLPRPKNVRNSAEEVTGAHMCSTLSVLQPKRAKLLRYRTEGAKCNEERRRKRRTSESNTMFGRVP